MRDRDEERRDLGGVSQLLPATTRFDSTPLPASTSSSSATRRTRAAR
ncbi:MAG: hypothetical protein U0271_46625 [Polyangiaceae bacterium]